MVLQNVDKAEVKLRIKKDNVAGAYMSTCMQYMGGMSGKPGELRAIG